MRTKFFAWIFLIVNLLLIANLIRDIIWLSKADERMEVAYNKLETLRQKNFHLKQEKAYREGKDFVEQQIRDKLGMAKPGEYVVFLPKEVGEEKEESNFSGQLADSLDKEDLTNWQKWLRLFL